MVGDGRRAPRKKAESIRVRYSTATQNQYQESETYDVSEGGTFVRTAEPLAPGTLLRLELHFAERAMHGIGRVVWKRDADGPGKETPAGMGIKFIKMEEATRKAIGRLPKEVPLW